MKTPHIDPSLLEEIERWMKDPSYIPVFPNSDVTQHALKEAQFLGAVLAHSFTLEREKIEKQGERLGSSSNGGVMVPEHVIDQLISEKTKTEEGRRRLARYAALAIRDWSKSASPVPTKLMERVARILEVFAEGAPNESEAVGASRTITRKELEEKMREFASLTTDDLGQFDFGTALLLLKNGRSVGRQGDVLMLIPADSWSTSIGPNPHQVPGAHRLPWIAMKTSNNGLVPWLASQIDLLADDWELVP